MGASKINGLINRAGGQNQLLEITVFLQVLKFLLYSPAGGI